MRLPVKINSTPAPVIPQNDWIELEDKSRLRKIFEFDDRECRLAFVIQLLSINDQESDRYKLLIDGSVVIVGINARDGGFLSDKDKKFARVADDIYRDVRFYARKYGEF